MWSPISKSQTLRKSEKVTKIKKKIIKLLSTRYQIRLCDLSFSLNGARQVTADSNHDRILRTDFQILFSPVSFVSGRAVGCRRLTVSSAQSYRSLVDQRCDYRRHPSNPHQMAAITISICYTHFAAVHGRQDRGKSRHWVFRDYLLLKQTLCAISVVRETRKERVYLPQP